MSRADELFRELRDANYERTSRMFAVLMIAQWMFGIGVALVYSPYGWEGKASSVHLHVWIAVFLGGAISSLPILFALTRPAAPLTRYTIAVGQMLWSALLIHLSGGRIETHFHVFGSLAFLAFYRDWKVLLPATVVVATDHLARQLFWPESVFGIANPEWWRFLEHAFWVVFEDIILITGCIVMTEEMRRIAQARADSEAKSLALQTALDDLAAAQEAKLRGEKLAAVGQLAASVGHELRNPLAAVRNANTFIQKKIKASGNGVDEKIVQFSGLIEHELDVCNKIIGDLLDFARDRPLARSPTPLRDLVEEAIALLPPSKIGILNKVQGELPMPELDKEQFRQVLINLTQNAVEALEPQGEGRITIDAERSDAGRWKLVVEDNGPGMPADVVAKVFEPLFTTKVKGTGLGLAIVSGIVKRHAGTIHVESKPGRGTKFAIEWHDPKQPQEATS